MGRRATLRASDAEREQIAERLRQAAGEGRIFAHELEERLEAVFSSRTYGELDAVVADLPGSGRVSRRRAHGVISLRTALMLAIMIPAALLVLAVIAFVVMGLVAAWAISFVLVWWLVGHRLRFHRGRYGRWDGRGSRYARRAVRG